MTTTTAPKRWAAGELRRMPEHEREAVLEAAARQAEHVYRTDRELTSFEAFGKDDLHVDSTDTTAR